MVGNFIEDPMIGNCVGGLYGRGADAACCPCLGDLCRRSVSSCESGRWITHEGLLHRNLR